jgi:hypothetical protein
MHCPFARPVNISCSDLVTEKSLAEAREGELRVSLRSQEEQVKQLQDNLSRKEKEGAAHSSKLNAKFLPKKQ